MSYRSNHLPRWKTSVRLQVGSVVNVKKITDIFSSADLSATSQIMLDVILLPAIATQIVNLYSSAVMESVLPLVVKNSVFKNGESW